MRGISLRFASRSAVVLVTVMLTGATRAANDTAGVSSQDVRAKLQYCEVCHGVSAQGFIGYYPILRRSPGSRWPISKNQLQGFSEHKRTNNIMFNVGHVLGPAMITALANGFHDLDPGRWRTLPGGRSPPASKSTRRALRAPMFPPARPVTARKPKGDGQFPPSGRSALCSMCRSN